MNDAHSALASNAQYCISLYLSANATGVALLHLLHEYRHDFEIMFVGYEQGVRLFHLKMVGHLKLNKVFIGKAGELTARIQLIKYS